MSVKSKRRQEQLKAKAAKRSAMFQPGHESKYAKRVESRLRGEPMATRPIMPWWYGEFSRVFAGIGRTQASA